MDFCHCHKPRGQSTNYQLWHHQLRFWTDLNSDLTGGILKVKHSSIPGISFGSTRIKNKNNERQSQPYWYIQTVFKMRSKKSIVLLGIGTNKNKAISSFPGTKSLNSGACLGSVLSLNLCVILGKLHNCWVPWFPHLYNGNNSIGTYLIGLLGLAELTYKVLRTVTNTLSANFKIWAIMIMLSHV